MGDFIMRKMRIGDNYIIHCYKHDGNIHRSWDEAVLLDINKDYLVFGFEEVAEVCLNDDESQNNLKSIFVKLLTEITKYPVELQFLENPEYKTGLYIDVCKEYIKDLNKEITNVRKNMPEKLKIQ